MSTKTAQEFISNLESQIRGLEWQLSRYPGPRPLDKKILRTQLVKKVENLRMAKQALRQSK